MKDYAWLHPDLSGRFDVVEEAEEDDYPGGQQTQHQLPANFAQGFDTVRALQHVISARKTPENYLGWSLRLVQFEANACRTF